jgi:protoporphyrin/coproporphyrin ferrochelatase
VLLVNSGSPDSLSTADIRSFLRGLLSDPRVIEASRIVWLPILEGVILTTRPRKIRHKYEKIWTPEGSPLHVFSRDLKIAVSRELHARELAPFSVEIAMLYSKPAVRESLLRLREARAQKILIVPLFPQYCASTTGAVFDQVTREIKSWRSVPELRFISDYHDDPGYIEALRASVAEHWSTHGRTSRLQISFHGIPERYVNDGDPYSVKCRRTAHALAESLQLKESEWGLSFQSRFGPTVWLQPYTADVMAELPKQGIDSVTVVCPGFAADCLETLEEIDVENRGYFTAAGGRTFQYVPALNGSASHARVLADLIARHTRGWVDTTLGVGSRQLMSKRV